MHRVSDIRYVGYGVTDLAAERKFYAETWGLREVGEKDGMIHFAAEGDDELYVVRLRPSERRQIDIIAFAADTRADIDGLHKQVVASGCRIVFAPRELDTLGGGYGFRFFSPDGLPFEVSSDVAVGEARALTRWEGIPVKISHVVLHSPKHKEAVAFFCDVLGFKVSDWLGDFMCFLRCNEWHHRLAFLPGPPCLNHVAYDMLSIDDMMRGIRRLKENEIDLRWGPGRHTAGNNTFSYFVSPGGFTVEYTSELEQVDEETWVAQTHIPSAETMDQWGIGSGGPQTMPHPEPDAALFQPVGV